MKGVYAVKRSTGTQIYISYTPKDEPRVRELFAFVDDGPEFSKRLAYAEREAAKEFVCRRAAVIEERHEERSQKQAEEPLPLLAEYVRDTYAAVLRRSDMKPVPREREIERVSGGTVGRYLGKFRLNEITRTQVEWFIDQRLGDGAGAAGINRDLSRLQHLLNDAADREELEGRLPRIAWRRVRMREDPKSHRPMRDDEELRLLGGLSDPTVRAYVEFLLHTGIRPDAGLLLRWEHVDFNKMVVAVPREINKTRAYRLYLNSRVQEVLRGLYASRPEHLRQPSATVFCHRDGRPRRSIRTVWASACAAAGIEGLHIRGLRATAATRIQEAGGNEFDVKLHLGHSVGSMGVTGRYVDPHEEHRRRIAELTVRQKPDNVVPLRPEFVTRVSSGGLARQGGVG